MANLLETVAAVDELDAWVQGIYQLEQEDLVLGGADGIDNLQAKQLLARSNWLKAQVLSLGADKQPLDAMLTALAALVTAADQTLYFTGPDAPALTALTVFARTLLAANDAAAARTTLGAASPADIAAAIAALVNSSPATLDTLNELAAALGNNPNFATTMTNALALKAPLDSPAFTGNPTAPTQAAGDNSTRLATTAFVAVAIAALPAIVDASETVKGVLEIATNAESQALADDSRAITPAKLAAAMQGANQTLLSAGYQKLPGGMILQWGLGTGNAAADVTITFPIAFPNNCFNVFFHRGYSAGSGTIGYASGVYTSLTQAKFRSSDTGQGYFYFAIGN